MFALRAKFLSPPLDGQNPEYRPCLSTHRIKKQKQTFYKKPVYKQLMYTPLQLLCSLKKTPLETAPQLINLIYNFYQIFSVCFLNSLFAEIFNFLFQIKIKLIRLFINKQIPIYSILHIHAPCNFTENFRMGYP